MELKDLRENWNALGETDPLWAILSVPEFKGGGWDLDAFFATGVQAVHELMTTVAELRPGLRRDKSLDFGCGAGRLTQALCLYFDHATGVDIAPSMIALANKLNKRPECCDYLLNEFDDLRGFGDASFDLVLSLLVLQHMPETLARSYLAEFVRVLRPGGVALFQIPSHVRRESAAPLVGAGASRGSLRPSLLRRALRRGRIWTRKLACRLESSSLLPSSAPRIDMYAIDQHSVEAIVARAGGHIIDTHEDQLAGKEWVSVTYLVGREA